MNEDTPAPAEEVSNSANDNIMTKWWLEIDGTPQGPHTTAYIALLLQKGRIQATAKVCPVGGKQWSEMGKSVEFAVAIEHQTDGTALSQLPVTAEKCATAAQDIWARFTNPELPRFANWLCIYCLLIVPTMMGVSLLFTAGGFSSAADLKYESPLLGSAIAIDVITCVAGLTSAVVLVLGGVLLRKRQANGISLLKMGLTVSLCLWIVELLVSVLWSAIVTVGDAHRPTTENWTMVDTVSLLVFLPLLLLALTGMVFEVVSLVWLYKNDQLLPLNETIQPQVEKVGTQ